MTPPRQRIVLDEGDFEAQAPQGPAAHTQTPQPGASSALPPVRQGTPRQVFAEQSPGAAAPVPVPVPGASVAAFLRSSRGTALATAGVGMVLAWLITEGVGLADIETTSEFGSHAATALWTGVIALIFVGLVVSWDRLTAGAWAEAGQRLLRAVGPALGIGALAGFMANVIYIEIVESIISGDGFTFSDHEPGLYFARAVGWAMFGAGAGVATGLAQRTSQKAINGAIGGAVGGTVGGIIFEFTANVIDSVALSRLLGLLAVGLLVAAAVAIVEEIRREAWVDITAGGMAGKQFILYHQVTRIGSDPACEIMVVKDPAVGKLHARIQDLGGRRVLSAASGASVAVNGSQIAQHELRHGDQVQVGNHLLAYSERALAPSPLAAA